MQNLMQTDYMYATRELTFVYIGTPMRSCFSIPLLTVPPKHNNAGSYDHCMPPEMASALATRGYPRASSAQPALSAGSLIDKADAIVVWSH